MHRLFVALVTGWTLAANADPFPSTYQPLPSSATLITNATILTGDGQRLDEAQLYIEDGDIVHRST